MNTTTFTSELVPLAHAFFNADNGWIMLTGAVTNVACSLVGCFLVLRRMSLMGDALSHAVLPGLVVAFLFSGSTNIFPLFLGAVVVGLLTTFLTQTLHQYAGVPSDASMGVVFTSLFALGVVMIKKFISGAHFDIACVYEGSLELTPFVDSLPGLPGIPRPLATTAIVLVANLIILILLWKEFKLSSFDAGLATTMGFSSTIMHYLLMVMVAVTTVASFEAVGSILVVAMLIVPAATAHLLTDRLVSMLVVSTGIAILSAVLGHCFAYWWDTNIAGMMAVAAGVLYGIAMMFSPRYGILSTMLRNLQSSLRVLREDLLSMLYRVEELGAEAELSPANAREAVGGGLLARWGLAGLIRQQYVSQAGSIFRLTAQGRKIAKKLVRSHRLWEAFLVKHLGLPLDHVHEPAHRVEHYIDERLREELASELDAMEQDPHGREIPE